MVGMAGEANMVAEYVRVPSKQFPKSRNPLSAESKFWRTFKRKVFDQQTFAVTSVDFCPTPPYDFAVTSSTRVVIYDGASCEVKKTISRFTDLAYSGSFRSDGQLLVAGGETGVVQVFDVNSRIVLRQLKGHTRAIHWVRYSPLDKLHVLSASDDNTARWWDVASQEASLKLEGHNDYVRCGATNPTSADIWATGSYDHTARIWDLRSAQSILTLEHGKPLEDVLFFPSGGLVATSGGNIVKIWDIIGGGKLLQQLGNHQKTVTTLCMTKSLKSTSASAEQSPRLLTASLDGHMRVFELNSYKVTHIAKYPAPILNMKVSLPCTTLVVGTATGLLSVRQRKDWNQEDLTSDSLSKNTKSAQSHFRKQHVLHPNNFRYFLRGRTEKASDEDYILARQQKLKLSEHDKFLRRFQYQEAIAAALRTTDPTVVIAVLEELVARGGLVSAISNLDLENLEIFIAFLSKCATIPKHSRLLVPVTHKVLDKCASSFGHSRRLQIKVELLREKVVAEVHFQESLQRLQGLLQPLIQASVR